MKHLVLVLALTACLAPLLNGQKTRYGQGPPKAKAGVDYPIQVHISGIRRRTDCTVPGAQPGVAYCRDALYADAELNGIKMELTGYWLWAKDAASVPLNIGDYQARVLRDTPAKSANPIGREYEVVFPDRTVWRGTVTGYSE